MIRAFIYDYAYCVIPLKISHSSIIQKKLKIPAFIRGNMVVLLPICIVLIILQADDQVLSFNCLDSMTTHVLVYQHPRTSVFGLFRTS